MCMAIQCTLFYKQLGSVPTSYLGFKVVCYLLSKLTKYSQGQLMEPSRGVLRKSILKICCKFTVEHPCRSVISIKLQRNFLKSHFGMGVLL